MRDFVRKQWFLFVLLGAVLVGYFCPGPGVFLRESLSIKWFIMPTLFLMSFSLKTGAIFRSFLNVRGLASAVVGGYLFTSLALFVLGRALFPGNRDLVLGLIACGATPCTLASAAIWTRLAGGNDALALAITIVSNLTSFLFSPIVLLLTLGSAVSPPFGRIMTSLLMVIVIPVALGQVLRIWLGAFADRRKRVISVICRLLILLVVLVSVSNASQTAARAEGGGLTGMTFVLLIFAVGASHLFALVGCALIARLLGAPAEDVGAVMFGGSQKTLPVGIYIAEMIAAARPDETLVFIALPILIYHATQLTIDSFLIGPYRKHVIGEDDVKA
ncbi:MAG: bile acid:sodium symporter [Planctomycetes bacterium]|nr:bile acid:sodium symporter [Planctomycetota bacterium]